MKQKKETKISLGTAITLTIIFLVLIIGVISIILNVVQKNNNEQKENIIAENNTPVDVTTSDNKTNENNDFDIEFLKLENNKKNMIYSPLSIKYALKMLNEGAEGNTKKQIENVIGNLKLTKYDNIENALSLANGIYIRDTFSESVKKEFENKLAKNYNAEIKYDSFENANNVNQWIEDKTLKIIKNMLSDDMVQDPNSKILLINALAIDMEWKEQFDTSDTRGEKFNLENGNEMTTTMMNNEITSDSASYYKDNDITAVTMDLKEYDDTQLEFTAIMPNNNNLSEYIKTCTMDKIDEIMKKSTLASKTKNGIDVYIPKFSFDYDLKLKEDLINLGIKDAFDINTANLSNMSNSELYVSDALHKANIDFTEKGVKAAAVTVFGIKDLALPLETPKPEEIRIDKPFLYVIKDKKTGEVWFVGTVYEPNSWENEKENY